MREAVIIPTFQRSEFLWVCLEAIRKAEPNIEIHVFPDRGTDETEVCGKFGASHHATFQHTYHGNSFNMLEALKWAYNEGYDRVFVVEDDCVVDETFFGWARNALDNPKPWLAALGVPFAVSGWEFSPDRMEEDGPDLLLNWYLSVCSCIPRESLAEIVKHAVPEYYANMKSYCDRTFPNDPRKGGMHFEQDGIILRIGTSVGKRFVWPRTPRAIHIGWRGYHMPHGKQAPGDLASKVLVVKMAVDNPDVMSDLMGGGQPPTVKSCRDCEKLLVSTNERATLVCVECFHLKHPTAPRAAESHYYVRGA